MMTGRLPHPGPGEWNCAPTHLPSNHSYGVMRQAPLCPDGEFRAGHHDVIMKAQVRYFVGGLPARPNDREVTRVMTDFIARCVAVPSGTP